MENYHIFEVKYLGATNTKGSRVKITSYRFRESITIPFDYALNSINEMAREYLTQRGFDIIGQGEASKYNILVSTTFNPLK
jgi:hypothetical protein